MKRYIFLLFIALSTLSYGQNIKKGFKSLEKKEFDKAQDAFAKNLAEDKENVAANFGMALILADDTSPLFNIIDAWEYIERIEGRTGELSQEDIEVLSEYFLNTETRRTSRPVKKKIAIALEAIEGRLIKYIREENNLDAVYEVLDRYPNFRHYDNVVHIRNQFEYRKYEKMNTRAAYEEFIAKFPDAAQVQKATKSKNKLAFEETKAANTVEAYSKYIREYPKSEFLQTAIKMRNAAAFSEAKRINTLEAFENYIENYPDALEVSDAKVYQQNLLYEQAKRIKSLQAFNDFIGKYPDGQYFVDIFNLKATEVGTLFMQENDLSNPYIMWVRGFDNNSFIESGGCAIASPEGDYIVACNTRENDTSYADAWVIRLNADGKMKWNKTIGQAFEDSVSNILLDSQGNIIVVGYTYLSADSASRKGWMFKLGADGKKLWNKNLGDINIKSSAIDSKDRIYIGGSIQRDTLGAKYALTTYNSDAQKIGEKVYTGVGEINDIIITDQEELILCGSNWITTLENKRYIKWDALLDVGITAKFCSMSNDKSLFVAGDNDRTIFYGSYSPAGQQEWIQKYDKTDSTHHIKDISYTLPDNFLVLEQRADGGKIKLFSPDGSIRGVKEVFGNLKLEDAYGDSNGSLLLITNRDLIVIRYSQLSTMQ